MSASKYINPWISPKLDPLGPELKLYFTAKDNWAWGTRCAEWQRHFSIYEDILGSHKPAAQIDFLFQHLGVVDQKLGTIFAVNSFLTIGLTSFGPHLADLAAMLPEGERPTFQLLFLVWSVAFGLGWFWVLFLCLNALRRLVWGDLGRELPKIRLDSLRDKHSWKPEDVASAKDSYVRDLIFALVDRTNKFRVAVLITNFNVTLLLVLFVSVVIMWIANLFHV